MYIYMYIYIYIWCIPWYTVYSIWRHPNRVLFSLWNTIHWNHESKKNRVFQWEWVYCSEQTDSGVSKTFESKPFGSNHQLGDSYGSWGLKHSHSYGSRARTGNHKVTGKKLTTSRKNCSPQPLPVAHFSSSCWLNPHSWILYFCHMDSMVESPSQSHFS